MHLFYCANIQQGETHLEPEESRHCIKALRKKKGDMIHITDGEGKLYEGELTEVNPKKCQFNIIGSHAQQKPDYYIHIALAPTKNIDRLEWFVEKAVEIGVDKISFLQTAFSERKTIKLERIKKKAISAMKQSIRTQLPKINEMVRLTSFLRDNDADQKFVAHLEDTNTHHLIDIAKPSTDYLILVGPEGGFSEDELLLIGANNFKVAKIGNYRLRTETAGIVACSILNNINNQL